METRQRIQCPPAPSSSRGPGVAYPTLPAYPWRQSGTCGYPSLPKSSMAGSTRTSKLESWGKDPGEGTTGNGGFLKCGEEGLAKSNMKLTRINTPEENRISVDYHTQVFKTYL